MRLAVRVLACLTAADPSGGVGRASSKQATSLCLPSPQPTPLLVLHLSYSTPFSPPPLHSTPLHYPIPDMPATALPMETVASASLATPVKVAAAITKKAETVDHDHDHDATVEVWDQQVQQYHGGQDWQFLTNFREDFSVTTNGLGTPKGAMEAAQKALLTIDHYPPANQEPALSSLARFLSGTTGTTGTTAEPLKQPQPSSEPWNHDRLILGNGASELIDLVVRASPEGSWSAGPTKVQYKEYQRSAQSHGRAVVAAGSTRSATFVSLVNPTNPTGDYMDIQAMRTWIEANVQDGATVTVDESMQLWLGPEWRADSLVSQGTWIREQWESRRVAVYVIHSWTKIWSCTGIRLGSIVCPTVEHCQALRRLQVPWSVNTPALAFLDAVVRDRAYLERTWECTPAWRRYAEDQLLALGRGKGYAWEVRGEPFLSWLWIDMKEERVADKAVQLAKRFGVPVRWAAYGYELPTCVRIATRSEEQTDVLLAAWKEL